MTQEQFKEILDSIEPGLYDKYAANKDEYFTWDELLSSKYTITLMSGFTWGESPEGVGFWLSVYHKFDEKYNKLTNENRI
jgi:hypothetical protein